MKKIGWIKKSKEIKNVLESAFCGLFFENTKLSSKKGPKGVFLPVSEIKEDRVEMVSLIVTLSSLPSIELARLGDLDENMGGWSVLMDKLILDNGNIPDSPLLKFVPCATPLINV
jgi:hypothetical protein